MDVWMKDFMESRYHIITAKRMLKGYYDFEEKRFLIGAINEIARSSSSLIRACLLKEGKLGRKIVKNIRIFEKTSIDLFGEEIIEHIFKSLEIEKSCKVSPVEFSRGDKIILLINGRYRFLTVARIEEFAKSIEKAINIVQNRLRQV